MLYFPHAPNSTNPGLSRMFTCSPCATSLTELPVTVPCAFCTQETPLLPLPPLGLGTLPPTFFSLFTLFHFFLLSSTSRIAKKETIYMDKIRQASTVVSEPHDQSDPRSCPFISPRLRHLRAGRAPKSALPFRSIFYGPLTHQLSAILANPSKYRSHIALVTRACRERPEQRGGAVPGPVTHFIAVLVPIGITLTNPTTTQRFLHAPPDIA